MSNFVFGIRGPSGSGGGGGGSFNPAVTLYFGPGGNDVNPGSITQPFLTAAAAATQAQLLISEGDMFVSIQGLGVGIDTSNLSITMSGIDIYAPGIQLNPVSGDAITVDLSGGSSASYFSSVFQSSTVAGGAKCVNLLGVTAGNGNVTQFYFTGATIGDVYLNNACIFISTIITGVLTANQAGTNVTVQYGIASQTQQTRLNLEGILFGGGGGAIHGPTACSNVWRYPSRQIIQLVGDRTLAAGDSGFLFVNSTSSTFTITLPDDTGQGTPAFLIGYEATFLNLSTGTIAFAAGGASTIVGASSLTAVGQRANCTLTADNAWEVDAQAGGSFTPHAYTNTYYVDDVNGNDSNSGTSIELPLLTYTQALTLAGTTPSIIYGINANTNNTESISTLSAGQIFILEAPGTTFNGAVTINLFDNSIIWNCANVSNFTIYASNLTLNCSSTASGIVDNGIGTIINAAGLITGTCNLVSGSQGTTYSANRIAALTITPNANGVNLNLICQTLQNITYTDSTYATNILNLNFQACGYFGAITTTNPLQVNLLGTTSFIESTATLSGPVVFNGLTGNRLYNDLVFYDSSGSPTYAQTSAAPTGANQVLLSSGAGPGATTSWGTAGGGGMTWSTISGTSQAAAVGNGYIVGNALQTTVTLPATAPVGSLVSVVGMGAAGWILAANTGQTIQFGSTATTSGGSFTSNAANDNIQVVCTVADTTWAVLSAVSADLTPA